MRFCLFYRGPLPSAGDPRSKDRIRNSISEQLWELVRCEPRLRPELDNAVFADLRKRRLVARENTDFGLQVVELKHRLFCPLVDSRRSLVCDLDISFFRREAPGALSTAAIWTIGSRRCSMLCEFRNMRARYRITPWRCSPRQPSASWKTIL